MGRKRTPSAPPLALTLDGQLLLNRSGLLAPSLLSKLAQALAVEPHDLFLGTRLPRVQRNEALTRLDDAGAEAAARIHGLATKSSSRGRSRKSQKKV